MKYRSRPEEVEVFRFCEESETMGPEWFGKMVDKEIAFIDRVLNDGASRVIGCSFYFPGQRFQAKLGDYIILWPSGMVTVEEPERFRKRFERMGKCG